MQWIKVSDRLPEEYEFVVAGYCLTNDNNIAFSIARVINKKWEWINSRESISGAYCGDMDVLLSSEYITHWLSVPPLRVELGILVTICRHSADSVQHCDNCHNKCFCTEEMKQESHELD